MLLSDCQRPKEKKGDSYMDYRRGEVTLRLLVIMGNDGKLLSEKKINLFH